MFYNSYKVLLSQDQICNLSSLQRFLSAIESGFKRSVYNFNLYYPIRSDMYGFWLFQIPSSPWFIWLTLDSTLWWFIYYEKFSKIQLLIHFVGKIILKSRFWIHTVVWEAFRDSTLRFSVASQIQLQSKTCSLIDDSFTN